MKIGDIDVIPLAAESLGVRSLCTKIKTPDLSILLDPSAALAFRPPHEPHPKEYLALQEALIRIEEAAKDCDILTISHYHFDHVRPGATNQRYNLSTPQDRVRTYAGKRILAKDGRMNINPSQRRRSYYFERDLRNVASIEVADGKTFQIGNTRLEFSHPLPHGPDNSPLGYVLATTVYYEDVTVVFAPDVQGPSSKSSFEYLASRNADTAILGGPPIYLKSYSPSENKQSHDSLTQLAKSIRYLVVDHHLLRTTEWESWISPVISISEASGNQVTSMAGFSGIEPVLLEAHRSRLYEEYPPSARFMEWLCSTDEYKFKHPPPCLG